MPYVMLPARLAATVALSMAVIAGSPVPMGASEHAAEESCLRVEVVAEGVERVLADDVGHRLSRGRVREVAVDDAGAVSLLVGRRLIRLGQPGAIEPRTGRWQHYLRQLTTPAGVSWAAEEDGAVVRAEDGVLQDRTGEWRTVGGSLTSTPDGSLWRVGLHHETRLPAVLSSDTGEWTAAAAPGLEPIVTTDAARYSLAETRDGRVWLGADRGLRGGGLAVVDDAGWEVIDTPFEDPLRVRAMEAAEDGALWVLADVGDPGSDTRHVLLRHGNDNDVVVLDADAGMPQRRVPVWADWSPFEPSAMTVDHAGRVWFALDGVGLWRYDGEAFERIDVPGLRPGTLDLETDPDGMVWAVSRDGGLYRLREPGVARDGSPYPTCPAGG